MEAPCTSLFLVPYSFFVFCCRRRGVSKYKHCSTAAKGPRAQVSAPLKRTWLLEKVAKENSITGLDRGRKSMVHCGVCACVLSRVQLFATLWTVAHPSPLSMEFSRQEYWSGWPFLLQGNLSHPGIEPASLASPALAGRYF